MIERYLKVKNFRNIGEDNYEKLELNYVVKPGEKLGGIVTLIGMNNSGKSNYLDALEYVGHKRIEESDKPNYRFDEVDETVATLWVADTTKEKKVEYQYKVVNGKEVLQKYVDEKPNHDFASTKPTYYLDKITQQKLSNELRQLRSAGGTIAMREIPYEDLRKKLLDGKANEVEIENMYNALNQEHVKTHLDRKLPEARRRYENILSTIMPNNAPKDLSKGLLLEFNKTYDTTLVPNIIKYDDTYKISAKNMMSDVNTNGKLTNPVFFKKLFSYLNDITFEELESIYTRFHKRQTSYRHLLTNFEKKANEKLSDLAKKFNRIYGSLENRKYDFSLNLESNKIFFLLSENENDVQLDAQSTGFRWFFNFFFDIFADEKLKNGDIIILDEPATNLHVKGKVELRKQLKEFGVKNGITFVISTHEPFLIDPSHLDEVRMVYKEGELSKVENKFTITEENESDVLLPVHSALTVDRHIILNPFNTLIFVEGITDYNYLTAFKELFDIEKINFMPVNGLRNNNLIEQLFNISRNPVILVDSDYAGKQFIEKSELKDALEVLHLNQYNESVTVIEDLFSPKDRDKYCDGKSYKKSTYFKNNIHNIEKHLTKETKKNFKELLNNISV